MLWLVGTARNAVVVFTGLIVARIVTAADSVHMKNTTELAGDDVFSLVGFVPAGLPTPGNPFGGDDIKWSELGTVRFIAFSLSRARSFWSSLAVFWWVCRHAC
jgi:hypothetical protein